MCPRAFLFCVIWLYSRARAWLQYMDVQTVREGARGWNRETCAFWMRQMALGVVLCLKIFYDPTCEVSLQRLSVAVLSWIIESNQSLQSALVRLFPIFIRCMLWNPVCSKTAVSCSSFPSFKLHHFSFCGIFRAQKQSGAMLSYFSALFFWRCMNGRGDGRTPGWGLVWPDSPPV